MKKFRTATVIAMSVALLTVVACTATRTQRAAGEQIDDKVLLAKIKTSLAADPVTEAHEINVEVYRGVVQLNGFVDSADQIARATKVAKGVGGVKEVRNNLAMKHEPKAAEEVVDDAALTGKVKAALIESSKTKAYQIKVDTQNGVVQLGGFVDDASAKSAAADIARSVAGVHSVKNEIDVKQR